LFDEICTSKHEPYTSIYVIDELEKTPDDKKNINRSVSAMVSTFS
jgi:hypothetical protein